ncbi:hypothetical protein K435DRAFT_419362 [Dendrothele bispora CBS 962.96]|uniref:Uncharacterized protein n=1 Tax=Dendrothele bispora (strain CBS 962.96) TaxID=1314807 RepID=A0A4S8MEU7_DENBC|nr:hypothetical protein K435DRAFT_419362 [Dendrothele bispora CBS 962.96]
MNRLVNQAFLNRENLAVERDSNSNSTLRYEHSCKLGRSSSIDKCMIWIVVAALAGILLMSCCLGCFRECQRHGKIKSQKVDT